MAVPLRYPRSDWWNWQLDAECADVDPGLFFPPDSEGHGDRLRRERLAKSVCVQCPVRVHCHEHALAAGESHGIWGGTSETERRRMTRDLTP
ncbi:WhiB family transcriptional regulator [Rhodococcus triatomae]